MSLATFQELLRELRDPQRLKPRLLDEVETVLSVLLAIVFAHLLHAQNVGWAAFSGYMVMRSRLQASTTRGLLRILGTVSGALLGWAAVAGLSHQPLLQGLMLAVFCASTLYCALTRTRSYAWLFTCLTFAMVILDTQADPSEATEFVLTRILEVCAGTVACLLVGAISSLTLRPRILGPAAEAPRPVAVSGWRGDAARHSLQAALALVALPWLSHWLAGPTLSQAAVTMLAVMMVPLSSLAKGPGVISKRIVHRFVGCLCGAVVAAAALLLCQGQPIAVTVLLCLGIMLGRHLENSGGPLAYVGTQFTLVYLVVFVPDSYANPVLTPGLERLAGIMLGVVLLQVVRLPWQQLSQWLGKRSSSQQPD